MEAKTKGTNKTCTCFKIIIFDVDDDDALPYMLLYTFIIHTTCFWWFCRIWTKIVILQSKLWARARGEITLNIFTLNASHRMWQVDQKIPKINITQRAKQNWIDTNQSYAYFINNSNWKLLKYYLWWLPSDFGVKKDYNHLHNYRLNRWLDAHDSGWFCFCFMNNMKFTLI